MKKLCIRLLIVVFMAFGASQAAHAAIGRIGINVDYDPTLAGLGADSRALLDACERSLDDWRRSLNALAAPLAPYLENFKPEPIPAALAFGLTQSLYPMKWQATLQAKENQLLDKIDTMPLLRWYNNLSFGKRLLLLIFVMPRIEQKLWTLLRQHAPPRLYGSLLTLKQRMPSIKDTPYTLNALDLLAYLLIGKDEKHATAIKRGYIYYQLIKTINIISPELMPNIIQLLRKGYNSLLTQVRAPAIAHAAGKSDLTKHGVKDGPFQIVLQYLATPVHIKIPLLPKFNPNNPLLRDPYHIPMIQELPDGSIQITVEEYSYNDATRMYEIRTQGFIIDKEWNLDHTKSTYRMRQQWMLAPGCEHNRNHLLKDGRRCIATLTTLPTQTAGGELNITLYDEDGYNLTHAYASKHGTTIDALLKDITSETATWQQHEEPRRALPAPESSSPRQPGLATPGSSSSSAATSSGTTANQIAHRRLLESLD